MPDFKNMSKSEAIQYCFKHKKQYIHDCDDNGQGHNAVIALLEYETIKPSDLPDYGFEYE